MTSKSSKSLLKNSEESFVLSKDVKKVGYMKKLKTMKKKYFVLREENDTNDASLSYYDNEKKFKNIISQPKRCIYLKNCFSINRKIDAKHKYAIAVYTKEECFATVVDNENNLKEWLEAIIELHSQSIDPKLGHILHYEHVWQIYINRTGLGQTRNMTGTHRICLTANTLYIFKVDPQTDYSEYYEFPLISIRRCGHTASTFFIELGRSSSIGPGELWIQAEDTAIAQNMHEVILNAMKSSKNHEEFGPSQRPRSASTSDKPISSRRPQTSLANQNASSFGTAIQTYSSSTSSSVSTSSATISSIRERCDSMPSSSRISTELESTHDSRLWTSSHYHTCDRSHSGLYNRTLSYSPPSHNPLSPSSCACSTESVGSSLSIEDFDNHLNLLPMSDYHSGLHNIVIPSEPRIPEEDTQLEDYLSMEPNSTSPTCHQMKSKMNLNFRSTNTSPLTSPTFSSVKSMSQSIREEMSPYMPMSPVGSIETESLCSSRRSSGLERNLIPDVNSSEYMPMISSQEIESTASDEYLNMAPLFTSLPRNDNSLNQKTLIKEEYHLEKVKSYFSPTEENDSLDYIKPVRAYSIGSRPQLKTTANSSVIKMNSKSKQFLPKSGAQTPEKEDETRIRAFSMGSHANAREARIAAKKKALIETLIGGPNLPIEEVTKGSNKASSAPVLSPAVPRKRSATVGSRPLFHKLSVNDRSDTDLMEIDYSKQSKSLKENFNEERVKHSSAVHRQRSNSRSSTSSSGIGSVSTTSPSITSSMNELNDKRKDHSVNVLLSMNIKSGEDSTQNSGSRAISKDTPNECLHIVMMNTNTNTNTITNSETKLPLRPITSQVSQLSTVPSIHSVVQQSHTKTLPTNKLEKIAQNVETFKKKSKVYDDSGDYVCLDMSSTNYVPQSYESSPALNVTQIVPKITTDSPLTTTIIHSISENEYDFRPINDKIEIIQKDNNQSVTKSQPISSGLSQVNESRVEPNADTSVLSQTSCTDTKTCLSPLLLTKKSMATNLVIDQTLSETISISSELASIEAKSFQVIGPQTENSYENVSLGSGSLSSSRPSSVSSEREINYASLDLASNSCQMTGNNNLKNCEIIDEMKSLSPRSQKSPNQLLIHSNVASSASSSCSTPIASLITCCGSQELLYSSTDSNSLSYAEIDFKKSESLRNTSSSGRN